MTAGDGFAATEEASFTQGLSHPKAKNRVRKSEVSSDPAAFWGPRRLQHQRQVLLRNLMRGVPG